MTILDSLLIPPPDSAPCVHRWRIWPGVVQEYVPESCDHCGAVRFLLPDPTLFRARL